MILAITELDPSLHPPYYGTCSISTSFISSEKKETKFVIGIKESIPVLSFNPRFDLVTFKVTFTALL